MQFANGETYPVIPLPAKLVEGNGSFRLDSSITIFAPGAFGNEVSVFTNYLQKQYGISLKSVNGKSADKQIYIRQVKNLPPGGYALRIDTYGISINASDGAGVLYAFETLKQLAPPAKMNSLSIPSVEIEDAPRFIYRGMHLDVSRHFFSKEIVKQYLDWMLMYKMNTFHWHLTDDQGWRIEIKKYPLLTKIGGWRKGTLVGHYGGQPEVYDSIPNGGFYTQDDIREIVRYATERHIAVIPEIEMPGHAMALLAAYPNLACTSGPFETGKTWGVYKDVLCPTEETFSFLENVLSEVSELFPGPYIHIGGDEVPKDRWKASAFCQQFMKEKGMKDESELQYYFTNRIVSYLKTKNKTGIGWDEILNDSLDPSAVVMSWRGYKGGTDAAVKGHDVIMAPASHVYFDMYQSRNTAGSLAIGGYLPIQQVYRFDPIPDVLNAEQAKHILGAQGNVWTEYITTPERIQEMVFPRMAALAEDLWTPKEKKNFEGFVNRLSFHFKYLYFLKLKYSKALFEILARVSPNGSDALFVELSSSYTKGEIRYTENGSDPLPSSAIYTKKIPVTQSMGIRAAMFDNGMPLGDEYNEVFRINKATGKEITLVNQPHPEFKTGGAFSLVNGTTGRLPWLENEWLGFYNTDLNATIDFGKMIDVTRLTIDMLNDPEGNIHFPNSVTVLISDDGKEWKQVGLLPNEKINTRDRQIRLDIPLCKARYINVIAKNNGGYLMVDEISVD